jgi:serine/threonine protein kinase
VNCLFNNFSNQANLLSQGRFGGSILGLYLKIVAAVKSVTKKSVEHTGYYFDGPLPNAYGQDTNSLQYVHYHCQLLCAKIGARAVLRLELSVSQSVHSEYRCPTVMCITTSLELPNDRLALVCPYYPATVAILPAGRCTLAMMCNVALCTIASIAAFRRVGLSHNDIKPANLMLTTTSQLVVLIDFGSAVKFSDGDASKGTTAIWGRDCPAGSEAYDMACLASVMYYLQHGADQDDLGLQQLAEHVQSLPSPTIVDDMVLDCINRANEDAAVIFKSWVAKVQVLSIQEGTMVDPSSIWPTPTV